MKMHSMTFLEFWVLFLPLLWPRLLMTGHNKNQGLEQNSSQRVRAPLVISPRASLQQRVRNGPRLIHLPYMPCSSPRARPHPRPVNSVYSESTFHPPFGAQVRFLNSVGDYSRLLAHPRPPVTADSFHPLPFSIYTLECGFTTV